MQQPIDIESSPIAAGKEAWMVRPLHKSECHRFEYRGNCILFDVATGVFFHVDDVVCDILDFCEGRSLLDLLNILRDRHTEKEILSAFRELYGAAILSDNPPEIRPFVPPGRLEIVHLGLDITYDGLSGAQTIARDDRACPPAAYMGEEVACKAVDLLLKESGRIRRCTVTFQGGEPLLNAQLVERVIDYALAQAGKLGKEIAFEVVSDSRLLNEQAFGLLRKRDADIVVKMDDLPAGDLPLFHGTGPRSLSSREIRDYAQRKPAKVHLNGSVNRRSPDLSGRMQQALTRYPSARSVSLRFGPQPADGRAADSHLSRSLTELEKLADYVKMHVLEDGAARIGDFEDCIDQVFNRKHAFYHCGAGTRYLTVAPDGRLYVCPGMVGKDAFCLGDVQEGIDRDRQKKWVKSTHVEQFESCTACWARYLCGGGCRLNSLLGSGEIDSPETESCSLIRRSYELAMSTCLDIASENMELLQIRYAEEN